MTTDTTQVAGSIATGAVAVFLAEAGLNPADLGYAAWAPAWAPPAPVRCLASRPR